MQCVNRHKNIRQNCLKINLYFHTLGSVIKYLLDKTSVYLAEICNPVFDYDNYKQDSDTDIALTS